MTSRTVKAYLLTPEGCSAEIRRFVLPSDDGTATGHSFVQFQSKVTSLFPSIKGKSFKLIWKDEEGDDIVMSSDEELSEAIQVAGPNRTLKIYIHCACSSTNCGSKKSSPDGTKPLHPNVVCDGCDGQIRGNRFKCLECEDYDLCEVCQARDPHPAHAMIRIIDPARGSANDGGRGAVARKGKFRFVHGKKFKKFNKCFKRKHAWKKQPGGWHPFGRRAWRGFFGPGRRCPSAPNSAPDGHARPHHGHHHNKKRDEERQTDGARTDSDPFIPLREQGTEFLHFIGQSVAAFLDPLGIDVSVDVEHPDSGHREHAANTTPKEASTQAKDSGASDKVDDVEMTASPSSSAPAEKSQAQQSTSLPEEVVLPTMEPSASPAHSSEGEGEWMMVTEPATNPTGVQSTMDTEVRSPEPNSSEPLHPNQLIAEAVGYMISMGFSNDGGWLTRLVEAKNGNIDSVLETLHPMNRNK